MTKPVRFVRWREGETVRLGITDDLEYRCTPVDVVLPRVSSISELWDRPNERGEDAAAFAQQVLAASSDRVAVAESQLVIPLNPSEVWATGVTYALGRDAREAGTTSAQTIYAKVYNAERPELFFKAPGYRTAGPGDWVGLRPDAHWHVPSSS